MHRSCLPSRFHDTDIWSTLLLDAIKIIEMPQSPRLLAPRNITLTAQGRRLLHHPHNRNASLHDFVPLSVFCKKHSVFTSFSYKPYRPNCRAYATTSDRRPSPFEVLNISQTASQQDLKKRYYELVKQLHPDKVGENTAETRARFDRVVKAYEILSDRGRRDMYLKFGVGWDTASGSDSYGRSYPTGQRPAMHTNAYWYNDPTYEGAFGDKPRFTSNPVFASIVAATIMVVVFARLTMFEGSHMDGANRHHLKSSEALKRAREEARLFGRQRAMERIFEDNMRHHRKGHGEVMKGEDPATATDLGAYASPREWTGTGDMKGPVVVKSEES
ncbi:hypothetical protein BC936DRAFT_145361 [Jimgerdemannia flammicorona]|uniref:Uncharacterized protein n=2 Tax=Jimgerdemannia flammicorona TaxID=994334 RepID=A0A433DAC3_9FUNG|nr:hypothetical protein BC936DRAFT_145361 [Jimgerdemannia flammicorona]RUS26131.1 hypothetical protein BC938DRAFT_471191 [Jimgerdemannia flammicorona]